MEYDLKPLGAHDVPESDLIPMFQEQNPGARPPETSDSDQGSKGETGMNLAYNGVFPGPVDRYIQGLEIAIKSANTPEAHRSIEAEKYKVLDYWDKYTADIMEFPKEPDEDFIPRVQYELIRLCLQLNRYGFRNSEPALYWSHLGQIEVITKIIEALKADPSLFADARTESGFWRILNKCIHYLEVTKSISVPNLMHQSMSSICGDSESAETQICADENSNGKFHETLDKEAPSRLLWHQFLHKNAPIVDQKQLDTNWDYFQVLPPGGQKILEQWEWENRNESTRIKGQNWQWKYGYTGLSSRKTEKTLRNGSRMIELVSDPQIPEIEELKDVEGRIIEDWEKRHSLEAITFAARNWTDEQNNSDAVLSDFLFIYQFLDPEKGVQMARHEDHQNDQ